MTIPIVDINDLTDDKIIGYVYFSRDTRPECLKFNKYLKNEYRANNNLIIYKFDTDHWRDDVLYKSVLEKYKVTEIPVLLNIKTPTLYSTFIFDDKEDKLKDRLHNFLNWNLRGSWYGK